MEQKTPDVLRAEFWEKDIAGGGIIYNQYSEIKRVLQTRDMDWVRARYEDLRRHAIAHTEFYKNYSMEDEFPVVNKLSLLADKERHTARDGFQHPIHISSTSGSTGTPFSVVQDYKKRNRTIADLKVFGELCDYPSHERMVFFRVLSEKLKRSPEQERRENIFYIDSSDLGDAHLNEMYRTIVEKQPRIVFSYPSTLVELAKYIVRAELDTSVFTMRSVLTAGEGVSPENRELLTKVFGCPLYRRYSNMEMGILGQDSGDGGAYSLNWGSYYFECLKLDLDEPAEVGETGRIVVTDLFNYAFPMIRYDTGDLGQMEPAADGGWPCLKTVLGRARDCVYTVDGRMIAPAKIFVTMWGAEKIKQWQFIQEDRDHYTLKLNADPNEDYTAVLEKLRAVLGQNAMIQTVFVDEIPVTASNKRRAVICNYNKQ